jgi:hypothetical protein
MAYLLDHAESSDGGWERQVKHCQNLTSGSVLVNSKEIILIFDEFPKYWFAKSNRRRIIDPLQFTILTGGKIPDPRFSGQFAGRKLSKSVFSGQNYLLNVFIS